MKLKSLLLALMAAAAVMPASAVVEYWVSPKGDDSNAGTQAKPFASVEAAVLSVRNNTETIIHLEKDATFMIGKLDLQNDKQVSFIGENTTLKGADKPGHDGGEANRILRIGKNCTVSVEGINFLNGRQVGYFPGGAIFFMGSKLTVNNCRFIGNEAGSGGGAIGSRGAHVIVKNSYFEDNYILGGGGVGPAIMHAGNFEDENGGSLIVENCTFYKNYLDQAGGHGNAIGIYDPSTEGGQFSITGLVDVRNCTFVENTNPQGYMASIDVSDNADCQTHLVNNTFYNEEVGFRFYFHEAPIYMFNNFMYCNKSAIINDGMSIADYDRSEIIGYNNVIIGGELAFNAYIDDKCFNANAAACSNTVGTAANNPIGNFGMITNLNKNAAVPFLAVMAASPLVNAGIDDTTDLIGENLILAYDCRNGKVLDRRDIGAFEVGADTDGIAAVTVDNNENAPVEYYNLNGVRVANPTNGLYIMRQGAKATKVIIK